MNNSVDLVFPKTMSGLAGYPYGKKVFDDSVKGKVSENDSIRICFPPEIEKVASSFTQGFFSEWLNAYGLDWILKNVKISAKSEALTTRIYENLTL